MQKETSPKEVTPKDIEHLTDASLLHVDEIDRYIELKKYKPLTEKEISKGKESLRIYGTQDPMPWSTIFTRLASGQPIEELAYQYGHGRKLTLFAKLNNVQLDKELSDIVTQETNTRNKIVKIANDDPNTAITLLQRVNEECPDFQSNVALFADKLLQRAITKLDDKYIEASDMEKLANAVQKSTDIVGVTQRHASAVNIANTNNIAVSGFDFVLDPPPTTTIDAEVTTDE